MRNILVRVTPRDFRSDVHFDTVGQLFFFFSIFFRKKAEKGAEGPRAQGHKSGTYTYWISAAPKGAALFCGNFGREEKKVVISITATCSLENS